MPKAKTPAEMAAALVVPGGSGNADDVAAIRPEIARLSAAVLKKLIDKGAHVLACRGSVTDVAADLRGKVPRGWEGLGLTWDNVPGTYLSSGKRVVLATLPATGGGRRMPKTGEGHGSINVALHETLHGHDFVGSHKVLKDKGFKAARAADFAKLPDYLRQQGDAGPQETYAESGARFFGGDPALAGDWPALFAFWSGTPIAAPAATGGGLGLMAGVAEPGAEESEPEGIEEGAIGHAEMDAKGWIRLDLRADGPGAVGHAFVTLKPGDEAYDRVRAHAFPARGGGGALGLARPASRTALLRPLPPV
jgi:hypothetical protein